MNPKKMMQQVQQMQEAMARQMSELRVDGTSGGGMVTWSCPGARSRR